MAAGRCVRRVGGAVRGRRRRRGRWPPGRGGVRHGWWRRRGAGPRAGRRPGPATGSAWCGGREVRSRRGRYGRGGAVSRRARSSGGYRACRGHSRPGAGRLGVETPARQDRDPPHAYGSVRPGAGSTEGDSRLGDQRHTVTARGGAGSQSKNGARPRAELAGRVLLGVVATVDAATPVGSAVREVPMVQAPGGRPRRAPRRGGRGAVVMACGSGFAGDGAPPGAVGEGAALSGVVAQVVRSTSTVARALTVWSRQPPDASQYSRVVFVIRSLQSLAWPRSGYFRYTRPSVVMVGRPEVPTTTILIVCLELELQVLVQITSRYLVVDDLRSTVAVLTPST